MHRVHCLSRRGPARAPIHALQIIEWLEDLKVARHSRLHPVSFRIGERPARLLLGLIDDLSRVADLHQPRQTKRATRHVLDQTLDARLIACRQKYRLIDNFTDPRQRVSALCIGPVDQPVAEAPLPREVYRGALCGRFRDRF